MQELIKKLKELKQKISETWKILKLDDNKKEADGLEKMMNQADFWQDQENAKEVSQRVSDIRDEIAIWENLKKEVEDTLEIAELDKEDKDINLREELEEKFEKLSKEFYEREFFVLFSGEYDKNNAILAIHAGAGGDDAQDWAGMLLRMFLRFSEKKGFTAKIIDESFGAEAGIKSVMVEIRGRYAYGYLKSEAGVHRLVRISPFDAEAMRHTSFALVEVLPELEKIDLGKIKINDDDLRIDVFRSGGKGGQSVNTTDSAVRIVHLPTKITVSCQNERSQVQNKETALKILKIKLHQLELKKQQEQKQKLRGEFQSAEWGSQIRSYVLHPYKMVKDHRTKFECNSPDAVLDGELNEFIDAYLRGLKLKD
ncbi:MAG: peptide chain release factor 2 [bacterium]